MLRNPPRHSHRKTSSSSCICPPQPLHKPRGHLKCSPLKENNSRIPNTPQYVAEVSLEEVDQLSHIKFMSKECSTIKEQEGSSVSGGLDFGPLFDGLNEREDFTLDICGVDEAQTLNQELWQGSKQRCFSSEQLILLSHETEEGSRQGECSSRVGTLESSRAGRIKRNATPKDPEVALIFESLDQHGSGALTPHNCATERLSTELNYLIGSMLNKIKRGKEYSLERFEKQFASLVSDSPQEQLRQILDTNRLKRDRINKQSRKRQIKEEKQPSHQSNEANVAKLIDIATQKAQTLKHPIPKAKQQQADSKLTPQQKIASRLNHLNDRLNLYILKNDLLGSVTARFPAQLEAIQEEDSLRYIEANTAHKEQPSTDRSAKLSTSVIQHERRVSQGIECPTEESAAVEGGKGPMKSSQTTMHTSKATTHRGSNVVATHRSDLEVVRGSEGGSFELSFEHLNRHLL